MPTVLCDGQAVELTAGESLLEAALRAGLQLPHSCRAGVCQSCLVKTLEGTPPAGSQAGLRPSLAQQGFLLACLARPQEHISVSSDAAAGLSVPGRVTAVARLSPDVVRVFVEVDGDFTWRAGQYVTLLREDGVARSYSVANHPENGSLEFHVRVIPGGRMSGWFASEPVGASLSVRGPSGECFYAAGRPDDTLVLAGTGTGLAPLWGVLHDALAAGHTGAIHVLHGARGPGGLYLTTELRAIAAGRENVTYTPCVLDGAETGMAAGALDDVVMDRFPKTAGHQFFLCGDPDLVQRMKRRVFLAGANLADIHADAFIVAHRPRPSGPVTAGRSSGRLRGQ